MTEIAVELPRGITGFHHIDEPPLPTCDLHAFRTSCHRAVRALGGRIVSAETAVRPASSANYVRATVELPGGPVSIVLNVHYPIIAFAAPTSGYGDDLQFVDMPALSEWFRGSGTYDILTALEAHEPVTEEACRLLSPTELRQLRYWRPRCIGCVVFNHWD